MNIIKKSNELEVQINDKVVKFQGHQDWDAFSVYTESFETCSSLSNQEREEILQELKIRNDIVMR